MRVETAFESTLAFEKLLEEAEEKATGDWQTEFVSEMRTNYEKWGGRMFISAQQHMKLIEIANGH